MTFKYELLEHNSIEHEGRKLYRIRALRDFGDVKAGEEGGHVENKFNLSDLHNCWIYYNAKVYSDALVHGNAIVSDNAEVSGNARVGGNAVVSDNAWVSDNAEVSDNAWVCTFSPPV